MGQYDLQKKVGHISITVGMLFSITCVLNPSSVAIVSTWLWQ